MKVDYYRKTVLTPMVQFTGDNEGAVREFCAHDGKPWGFAVVAEFGSEADYYRNYQVAPCPFNGGYQDGAGGYRGDTPDAAVYDEHHQAWIPLWRGDFVARGPQGENYPIKAHTHADTYEYVKTEEE